MKRCPNCKYLWADEHVGPCTDCGNPMTGAVANDGLSFAYAKQLQEARREADSEASLRASRASARPGDAHDRVPIHDSVLAAARNMIVQKGEVDEG